MTVKVAISLPEDLLQAAETERQARGETRSEFFRHALESYLRQQRDREDVKQYIQGYRDQPETEEEVEELHRVGSAVLSQEPWE